MDPTRLRKRLEDGEVLLGFANNYPSPAMIESVGPLWDFIWIDGQHGQFSYDSVLASVRAADAMGVASIVRVPGPEYGVVGPYADTFPSAVMVPMVDNAQEAAETVRALRFPPLGRRSFGGRRPVDIVGRDYYRTHEPLLIVQIETPEAVANAADIAAVEGIDVLFLGTEDLKIHLGLPISLPILESRLLVDALAGVAQGAKNADKVAGCSAMHPELFRCCVELGYRLIAGGSDRYLLYDSSQERVRTLRNVIRGPVQKVGQVA